MCFLPKGCTSVCLQQKHVSDPRCADPPRVMSVVFIDTVTAVPAQLAISLAEMYQYSVQQARERGVVFLKVPAVGRFDVLCPSF